MFAQRGVKSVAPNTLDSAPQLVELAPGAWGLLPGAPGTGTADTPRVEPDARDALGERLVQDDVADPGAFAARARSPAKANDPLPRASMFHEIERFLARAYPSTALRTT